MAESFKNLELVTVLLWGLVSFAGGATFGSLFGMSGRELWFPIALFVGGYALFITRETAGGSPLALVEKVNFRKNGKDDDLVTMLLERGDELSSDEAREWLDRFLVKQQEE